MFVVRPLDHLGYDTRLASSLLFTVVLLAGIITVSRSRTAALLFALVAVVSVSVHWSRYALFGAQWVSADSIATFVAVGTLAAIVLVGVLREGPITAQRIQGAIAAYMLIALMFAAAYTWIDVNVPAAFTGPVAPPAAQRDPIQPTARRPPEVMRIASATRPD